MISVMKGRDIPARTNFIQKLQQCSRPLWKFETKHQFRPCFGTPTSDHMTNVKLRQFIISHIDYGEVCCVKPINQLCSIIGCRICRYTNKDMSLIFISEPIIEFGNVSVTNLLTKRFKCTGRSGMVTAKMASRFSPTPPAPQHDEFDQNSHWRLKHSNKCSPVPSRSAYFSSPRLRARRRAH